MVRNELGLKQLTFRKESTDTLPLFPSSDLTGMVCYDVYTRGGLQPYFPTEPPSTVAPTTTSTLAPPRPRRSFQEIFQHRSNQASCFFTFRKLTEGLFGIFYFIQQSFVCRPSDSIVSKDACWDRIQDCCDFGVKGSQQVQNIFM
jgi:hypothetical protein